jgi:hypothetical protein
MTPKKRKAGRRPQDHLRAARRLRTTVGQCRFAGSGRGTVLANQGRPGGSPEPPRPRPDLRDSAGGIPGLRDVAAGYPPSSTSTDE